MFQSYYKNFRPFHNIAFNHFIKNDIHYMNLAYSRNSSEALISKNLTSKTKDYKFISRNFWQKIINKYWQETIYLSISNHHSEVYINKLRASGLSVYKDNDYKYFLMSFNKELVNGNIFVSLGNLSNYNSKMLSDQTYLKYIWRKKLYLSFFYFNHVFHNLKSLFGAFYYIRNQKTKYIYNSFPLFSLVNDSNNIIMAESSDQVLLNKSWLGLIYNYYINLFSQIYSNKKVYTSLFFINSEDALEYKNYIEQKYLFSSRHHNIKLFISPLYFYFKLLNLSSSQIEFRIIPDLKEVSDLLYKYKKYKNVFFEQKQKYGKTFFKGQPIYMIQPLVAKSSSSKQKKTIDYYYSYIKNNKAKHYKAIFLNYNTVIKAWNKFRDKNSDYILPRQPIVKVFNLEDFLDLYISNTSSKSFKNINYNNFIVVPSAETYVFTKNNLKNKTNYTLKEILIFQIIFIKQLFKRILWSLTSRQPIN